MVKKDKKSTSQKSRKNSTKIALDSKTLILLSGVIIIVCILFLAGNFLLTQPTKMIVFNETENEKPEITFKEIPTSEAENEKSGVDKKNANLIEENATAKGDSKESQKNVPDSKEKKLQEKAQNSSQSNKNPISKEEKIASVQMPKSGAKIAENAKNKFSFPSAMPGVKLCFVIDDAGLSVDNVKKYTSLPFPLTIAVLPQLSHSAECAEQIRASGKELILHQPMQAHAYSSGTIPDPGPGAILPEMSTLEVAQTIKKNLDSLGGGVKGFNNHEGSLITENNLKMGAVMEVASERGIYFLDSRTTAHSAAFQAALECDMPYIARYAPFLDNVIDRESMLKELYKGLAVANDSKEGYAVIIGHVDKSVKILPQLLLDIYPELVKAGYVITTPSKLKL